VLSDDLGLDEVDAVLVDLGGVVYLPDHVRVSRVLGAFDLATPPDDLDRAHYAGVAAIAHHVPAGHHADGSSI
jgi:hypothetical protein